jgi:hypothetical protein
MNLRPTLVWIRIGLMADCCDDGNEHVGSIKIGDFWLSNRLSELVEKLRPIVSFSVRCEVFTPMIKTRWPTVLCFVLL